ncbi:MAG: rRNA maturation RNase YbeY [Planctomycetota bacterium]|nr:MAG: rRNA maturation RNase YbeY [Planctomycetota bacterium]
MAVQFSNTQDAVPIDEALLRHAAQSTLDAEGAGELEVSITITDDARIHELNRRWLQHDEPTDVISFPLRTPDDPDPLLGEVVCSAERAREEALRRGLRPMEELARYVVHGCLHLLGWDDREPAEREAMHARQEEILARVLATGR